MCREMQKWGKMVLSIGLCLLLCISLAGCGSTLSSQSPTAFSRLRAAVGLKTREEKIYDRADKDRFPSAEEIGL